MQLDQNQQKVVQQKDGPVLVIAGAGSGKTTAITHRIANLIKQGVEPSKILAITFTNKAAREMKSRITKALSKERLSSLPTISTFHSLCVRILKEFYKQAGIKKSFSIYDKEDSLKVIKQAMEEAGINKKEISPSLAQAIISKYKNQATSFEDFHPSSYKEKTIETIWRKYEELMQNYGALDFDDLLLRVYKLLKNNPQVREVLSKRYSYIHVDEYQDTNEVQFLILKHLATHKNICVVGDIDQAIYGFRNARPQNLLDFEKVFPNTTTIFLTHNYRSSKTIVEASDALIANNEKRFKKTSVPTIQAEEKIKIKKAISAQEEALFVANQIKELKNLGYDYGSFAVLYRTNFQSRQFEEVMLKEGIPYHIVGVRFFNRKEVKDLISFLRLAQNPDSLADLARVSDYFPGIGKKTISQIILKDEKTLQKPQVQNLIKTLEKIKEFLSKNKLSESVKYTIELVAKDYYSRQNEPERLENLYELYEFAKKYDQLLPQEALESFLEEVALLSDQDNDTQEQKVRLLTVHAAKGLEFDVVFVVGLEEGLFPHMAAETQDDQEEERRLFYVAITRAKQKLFLTHSFIRNIRGESIVNEPSRFIFELPQKHVEFLDEQSDSERPSLLDDIDW